VITLAIDASTYVGTVAVLCDRRLLAQGDTPMRGRDVERLMPAVVDAMTFAGVEAHDIGRVVCGDGPGSFTSLRIAASIAKGIAMGLSVELKRVSSLALIPAGGELEPGRYLAALDALRGEAYFQRFRVEAAGEVVPESRFYLGTAGTMVAAAVEIGARIVAPQATLDLIREGGPELLPAPIALGPHARGVGRLEAALEAADLAVWEPKYGRLAEAQVKWEAQHGRPLSDA
jgi:tRNA threonylcarbamoyladenosine biosynthesis protein TsaB